MSGSFAGQRILVTGASSGIGRALALRLATNGAQLAVVARRRSLLDQLAAEIVVAGGADPVVLSADLAVAGAGAALGERVLVELGGLDILINNAGTSLTGAMSCYADDEVARAVFETNLWTPLALMRAVLPTMRAAGSGTIVNVTSTIQAVPLPLLGYYAASKAALAQATRSLRLELASTPIRVLEVVPGSVNTALRDVDKLPWRVSPSRTLPPVSADAMAGAVLASLRRGHDRLVHPPYSLLPLEIPAIGRLVAGVVGRRVDTAGALDAIANPRSDAR